MQGSFCVEQQSSNAVLTVGADEVPWHAGSLTLVVNG